MIHDPALAGAIKAPSETRPRLMTRLGRLMGLVEEDGSLGPIATVPPEPAAAIAPLVHAAPAAVSAAEPGIEVLAAALAQLIATAQTQLDGAATLIGHSADEAQAYGHALADHAEKLDLSAASSDVAAALIEVTRSMIDRTRGAEERLRTMGAELETLQRDLDDAREMAERDALTGLPNRRALEAALKRAVESARRCDQMLSLAFCDIDHFKQLNDRHGHHVGDRVLRLVADCLTDSAGKGVLVCRQGGEEFVMLFEGLSADQAAARVDAIRAQLYEKSFRSRTDDTPLGRIAFSAGVAMLRGGEEGDDLLCRADAALYRAKDNGRNRVEVDRER